MYYVAEDYPIDSVVRGSIVSTDTGIYHSSVFEQNLSISIDNCYYGIPGKHHWHAAIQLHHNPMHTYTLKDLSMRNGFSQEVRGLS